MYSNYECGFACELALIEWLQLDGCYTPIDSAWQIMLCAAEDSSKHWPGRAYIRRCLLLFKMMIVNLFTWIKSSLNDAGRNNCCSNFDTENSSSLFFLHMYTNLVGKSICDQLEIWPWKIIFSIQIMMIIIIFFHFNIHFIIHEIRKCDFNRNNGFICRSCGSSKLFLCASLRTVLMKYDFNLSRRRRTFNDIIKKEPRFCHWFEISKL